MSTSAVHDDEGMLGDNAREIHTLVEDGPLTTLVASDDEIKSMLTQRLGSLGIDLRHQRMPLQSDSDYEANNYDLYTFLGMEPAHIHELDIQRKCRRGTVVLLHDRLGKYSTEVQRWSSEIRDLLKTARDEAIRRIPMHSTA